MGHNSTNATLNPAVSFGSQKYSALVITSRLALICDKAKHVIARVDFFTC